MDAGYSKTPLLRKLGIKTGFKIWLIGEPDKYLDWLGPLPDDVLVVVGLRKRPTEFDFVHCFSAEAKKMAGHINRAKIAIHKNGMVWLSWPKKTSGVKSDLDGNTIRELGLNAGLVDVKVAAISDVWSGHKFVYRKIDR